MTSIRIKFIVMVGALLLLCLAHPALLHARPAGVPPFTPHFAALQAEVTARLGALTGTLTPAQKKEKSTLGSMSKAIAKKSTSLATDMKTVVSITNTIAKTFPGDPVFDLLQMDLLDQMAGEVQGQAQALEFARLNMVSGATKTGAVSFLLTANGLIVNSQVQPTHVLRAKDLNNALALIVKAQKSSSKAAKITKEGVACQVNAFAFVSKASVFTVSPSSFSIEASQPSGPNVSFSFTLTLDIPLVSGANVTIPPGAGTVVHNDLAETFIIDGGSLVISKIDTIARTATGSFLFSATGPVSGFMNVSQGYFTTANLTVNP